MTPDAVLDSVALVQAVRDDDLTGCRIILRNCDRDLVAVTLAKLLAEAADDLQVTSGELRAWGISAAGRP